MDSFSKRLKVIRKAKGLSQVELSEQLHMGQSTIANYESGKRMPSVKILLEIASALEVPLDQLVTEQEIAHDMKNHINDARAMLKENPNVYYEKEINAFLEVLIAANMADVIHFMMKLSESQLPLSKLYDYIFTPALYRVGESWSSGELDVFQEHFITSAVERGIQYLFYRQHPKRFSESPRFMGVLAPNERHDMGLKMMTSHLLIEGWTTYDLGGYIEADAVIKALMYWPSDILGISCTMEENLGPLSQMIDRIREIPNLSQQKIILCGQAFRSPKAVELKHSVSAYAFTIEEAMTKINALVR